MLDALGLDSVDTAVYRLMLQDPGCTVEHLAKELSHDHEDVLRALGNLKRLSLLRPSWTDHNRLRAVSPEVGLRLLIEEQEADLRERHLGIDRARSAVQVFASDYDAWRTDGCRRAGTEALDDLDEVCSRLEEYAFGVRREIRSFCPRSQMPEPIEELRVLDSAPLERGVAVRKIYLASVHNNPTMRRYAYVLCVQGAQLRISPVLPIWMMMFDDHVAVLPIDPEDPARGVLIVRDRSVLGVLADAFERTWEAALPFDEFADEGARDDAEPTQAERAALNLLAQGLTDEAVARRLGVSRRTVRRMMARLMKILGTRSRFEAGVRAAKRGWL